MALRVTGNEASEGPQQYDRATYGVGAVGDTRKAWWVGVAKESLPTCRRRFGKKSGFGWRQEEEWVFWQWESQERAREKAEGWEVSGMMERVD